MLADLPLARRLERAEGRACAGFVEARAQLDPASGAEWIEVAGTYAMFDGPRSPVTQTFGLGIFEPPCEADLEKIESFFFDRGAPVSHDVSPLSDRDTMPLLCTRGYRPIEFASVMFLPLADRPGTVPAGRVTARRVAGADHEVWGQTAAEGWQGLTGFDDLLTDMMRVTAVRRDTVSFLAELEGRPIASAALLIHDGVALMAGASTIPDARRQGAQAALLEIRLRHAVEAGCDVAMMCAEPGSASQRNAERQGFRIAYTRVKWCLDRSA